LRIIVGVVESAVTEEAYNMGHKGEPSTVMGHTSECHELDQSPHWDPVQTSSPMHGKVIMPMFTYQGNDRDPGHLATYQGTVFRR
jgi:hypothetical protein